MSPLLAVFLCLGPCAFASAQEQQTTGALPVVTIGVVIDGPWVRNDEITALFSADRIVAKHIQPAGKPAARAPAAATLGAGTPRRVQT